MSRPASNSSTPRRTMGKSRRLTHDLQYQAVYDARLKKTGGPLAVCALPNSFPHPRLGLSVPRRVGTAPRRNRIKRLLREAFRHIQHDLPRHDAGAYDYVVGVRTHEPLKLAAYQELLVDLAAALHRESQRRDRRNEKKET